MYVTRGLSVYRKDPSALSIRAPDYAPNTGVLVITDDDTEEQDAYCWGICYHKNVTALPFPQNKILSIVHRSEFKQDSVTKVWFLPVLGHPLSAHRYYIIRAKGQHKGKACTSSKRADICSCCCYSEFINDVKPRPFDPRDIYQQFEIRRYHGGGFYAKSVAYDGVPPDFLRKKGWEIRVRRSIQGHIHDAFGLDESVQASLPPPPTFPLPPLHLRYAAVVIGRWYTPFLFLREEAKLWRHMKKSMFYEITLEQYWEEIYSKQNERNEDDSIVIDAMIKREEALVYGMESVIEVNPMLGIVNFTIPSTNNLSNGSKVTLGMSLTVFESMRGIQVERGWMNDTDDDGCSLEDSGVPYDGSVLDEARVLSSADFANQLGLGAHYVCLLTYLGHFSN